MLLPDKYYHIYNHAIGDENLFREEENYYYFLQKYAQHITPIADTFAYCLMPNHFHLLVRIKREDDILTTFPKILDSSTFPKFQTLEKLEKEGNPLSPFLSKQFANLFSSYTQSYNKVYHRKGSLFLKNFKRKEITNEAYFTKLIHYIHHNPVHHRFTDDIAAWPYSSYDSLLSDKPTQLKRNEVLDWFGSKEDYRKFHTYKHTSLPIFDF